MAEAAWTDDSNKDYESYQRRLRSLLERYDVWDIDHFDPFTPEIRLEPQK